MTLVVGALVAAPGFTRSASADPPTIGTYYGPGWSFTAKALFACHCNGTGLLDYEYPAYSGDPYDGGTAQVRLIGTDGCDDISGTPWAGLWCPYGTATDLQIWTRSNLSDPFSLAQDWPVSKEVFDVELSADVPRVDPSHGAILTASWHQNLGTVSGEAGVEITDLTTGRNVPDNFGEDTTKSDVRSEVYVKSGQPHQFQAQLIDQTQGVLASSGIVTIGPDPWTVSLAYNPSSQKLVAATDVAQVTAAGYQIKIYNSSGAVIQTCSSSPCLSSANPTPDWYVAEVTSSAGEVQRSNEVHAPTDPPSSCQCSTPDPINTANGVLTEPETDLSVADRGLAMQDARTYNSANTLTPGPFGTGWQPSFGMSLRPSASSYYGEPVQKPGGGSPLSATGTGIDQETPGAPFDDSYYKNLPVVTATYSALSPDETSIPSDAEELLGGQALSLSSSPTMRLTEPDGSTVLFTSDGSGNFSGPSSSPDTLTENSDGSWTLTGSRGVTWTFSPSGWLTSQTDPNGDMLTYTYDTDSHLTSITDQSGQSLTFAYDSNDLISSVTDPAGRQTAYGYNSSGELTSVTDPAGNTTGYSYDSDNRLTGVTHPDGYATSNTYDTANRVIAQQDRAGRTTSLSYTAGSTTITEPNGSTTVDTYNDNGEVQSHTTASGTPEAQTTSYTYDPTTMQQTSATDADGNTTRATYNSRGDTLSETDARGHTESWTYNSLDEPLTFTDRDGNQTTYSYDSSGNLLTETDPIDATHTAVTHYSYGDSTNPGLPTAVTDPDTNTIHLAYDQYGELTSVTDGDGNQTTYSYSCGSGCENNIGWVYSTVSPRGNTTGGTPSDYTTSYSYDGDGRTLTSTDPDANTTTDAYNSDGDLTSVTDPRGHTTTYTYNKDDQPTGSTLPDSSTTAATYDSAGNLTSQTDGNNHTTTYTYNPLNELTSKTTPATASNPDGITTSYTYDPAGNLASKIAPGSGGSTLTTSYGYDTDNQLTGISYSDASTPSVSYGYNANGWRTSMTDGTGTSSYSYDEAGELTSTTDGAGHSTGYSYDPAGNTTAITYPNGHQVTRAYDAANQLTATTDWQGNTTSFAYNADGELTTTTYPNGVVETNHHDHAGVTSELTDTNSGSTLADYNYSRNADDQLTAVTATGTNPGPNQSTDYNALGELTSDTSSDGTSGAYSYDNAGNITGTPAGDTLNYDPADELTSTTATAGTTADSYNPRGDRTTATPPTGSAISDSYNQADELTGYTNGQSADAATYTYNGDGLRTSKTVNSTTSSETWDQTSGSDPLILSDGTTNYLYGPNDEPVEQIAAANTVSYVTGASATDGVGTASSLTASFTAAQAGDLILLDVNYSSGQNPSPPSGYTTLNRPGSDGGSSYWIPTPAGSGSWAA